MVPEHRMGDFSGGIVDSSQEAEIGASAFEPIVVASVNLQQHALLGIALSAAAMLWWPSLPGTAYANLEQDTTDGGTGHGDTVSLSHHLGEMLGIEAAVGRLSQIANLLLHLGWHGIRWRSTSITVC